MVATREQAQADLKPYVDRLKRCVQDAIREFLAEQKSALYLMRGGTQASLLRDYIVKNITAEFPEDEPGVNHSTRRGLFLLNIKNRYFLRFKKLRGKHLRTRNIPTQLSLDYLLQRPLVLFPDLEPATHLNVGYRPGLTLSESTIWITCPDGNVLDWKWGLSEEAEPVELPVELPSERSTTSRVRPKPVRRVSERHDDRAP